MVKTDSLTVQAIKKTIKELKYRLKIGFDEDILGAKAIEAALRLTSQLCIFEIWHAGLNNEEIAEELTKRDVPTTGQTIGRFSSSRHTPQPKRATELIRIYLDFSTAFQRARKIPTPFIE